MRPLLRARTQWTLDANWHPVLGAHPPHSTGNALPHPTSRGVIQLLPPEPIAWLSSQLHTTAQPFGWDDSVVGKKNGEVKSHHTILTTA